MRMRMRILLVASVFFSLATHANDGLILSFYITNDGIISTIGRQNAGYPLLSDAVYTSTDFSLIGDPPTIIYNDSPLKFFHAFMERFGPKLEQIITQEQLTDLPLKIYVASAGADKAKKSATPTIESQPYYADFYGEKSRSCYKASNKQEFFACMFALDIEPWIHKKAEVFIEQDSYLMATMATQRLKKTSHNEDVVMVHTTTYSKPYYLSGNTFEPDITSRSSPQDGGKLGGSFQTGANLNTEFFQPLTQKKDFAELTKKFKSDLELKKNKKLDEEITVSDERFEIALKKQTDSDLICVLYLDPFLHKACYRKTSEDPIGFHGASRMIYRLSNQWLGCNFFGDKVREVAEGLLPTSIPSIDSGWKIDVDKAKYDAIALMKQSNESLTDIIITFLYTQYKMDENTSVDKFPRLILVGEKINTFEFLALHHFTTISDNLLKILNDENHQQKLFELLQKNQIVIEDINCFKKWLVKHAKPVIRDMLWIPSQEFTNYMHTSAQSRTEKVTQSIE